MRRLLQALALGCLLVVAQPILAAAAGQVAMTTCSGNLCFNPAAVSISAGSSVTWTNQTAISHTVTSDTGAWPEAVVGAGASTSITFGNPGTFAYHCRFHPSMVGSVAVAAAAPTPAPTAAPIPAPAVTPSRLAPGGGGPGLILGAGLLLFGIGMLLFGIGLSALVRRRWRRA